MTASVEYVTGNIDTVLVRLFSFSCLRKRKKKEMKTTGRERKKEEEREKE